MRILALTNLYPSPLHPNRATFNRQQFAALSLEHEVRVIAPIAWTDEWAAGPKKTGSRLLPADRRRVVDGVVVDHPRYLFTPKMFRGSYGHFAVLSVRASFEAAVSDFRPDVVLGCWAYPDGWAATRLAREAGLPVVVKVHGSDLLTTSKHPGRRKRTQEALTAADAVVTVSRQLRDEAVALGADPCRVSVVYNGVDGTLFKPASSAAARSQIGPPGDDPLLLFVGNLVAVKGIGVLIDALARLKSAGQSFQCVLIGSGPLKGELQRRIDAHGLSDRVRLIGSRPMVELARWYQAADLVVLPSHSEGVPNVLLEAAACGTPFIATRVGGIPEIAPDSALVAPGDAAALAGAIGKFLESPHRTASPFKAGPWADSARTLASVLQSVMGDGRSKIGRAA